MERKEAIARGFHKFETGRPCINGHVTFRYTDSGSCADCINGKPMDINKERMAVTVRLSEGTKIVKLFALKESLDAIKIIIDNFNAEAFPDIPPNYINGAKFRTRHVRSNKQTLQIKVIVPNDKVEEITQIANSFLPAIRPVDDDGYLP